MFINKIQLMNRTLQIYGVGIGSKLLLNPWTLN